MFLFINFELIISHRIFLTHYSFYNKIFHALEFIMCLWKKNILEVLLPIAYKDSCCQVVNCLILILASWRLI